MCQITSLFVQDLPRGCCNFSLQLSEREISGEDGLQKGIEKVTLPPCDCSGQATFEDRYKNGNRPFEFSLVEGRELEIRPSNMDSDGVSFVPETINSDKAFNLGPSVGGGLPPEEWNDRALVPIKIN